MLGILSKLLKNLVNKSLINDLEKYELLSSRHFGFRRGKSPEDCCYVVLLTNAISFALENSVAGMFSHILQRISTMFRQKTSWKVGRWLVPHLSHWSSTMYKSYVFRPIIGSFQCSIRQHARPHFVHHLHEQYFRVIPSGIVSELLLCRDSHLYHISWAKTSWLCMTTKLNMYHFVTSKDN